jgi:hypothetical protein
MFWRTHAFLPQEEVYCMLTVSIYEVPMRHEIALKMAWGDGPKRISKWSVTIRSPNFAISLTEFGIYGGLSKSFRTGHPERELQMIEISATRCSCVAILWVSLVSFAAITRCVAYERVFIVSVYFFIDPVRKLWDTTSCVCVFVCIHCQTEMMTIIIIIIIIIIISIFINKRSRDEIYETHSGIQLIRPYKKLRHLTRNKCRSST